MKYKVTPRPVDHRIDLTAEDITAAVLEWIDRNSDAEIPVGTRLYLSEHEIEHGASKISGYMSWDSDDIDGEE